MIMAIAVTERGETMSEYIKKDSVIKSMTAEIKSDKDATLIAKMLLADVPEEDVIDVVRCRDCKYRKKVLNCSYGECMYSASMVTDNDFCSNGEVKTNEQEKWDV